MTRMKTVCPRSSLFAALLALAAAGAGCRRAPVAAGSAAPQPDPVIHEQRLGRTLLRLRADAAAVRLERDLHLTVETSASPELEVTVTAMDAGPAGFDVVRWYDDPPRSRAATIVRRRHVLLRPRLAEQFRTPALTVRVTDRGRAPPEERRYTTDGAPLPLALPVADAPADIVAAFHPLTGRESLLERSAPAALAALAAALAAVSIARVARRVAARRRRLRPARRALRALHAIEADDLPGAGRFKEFYQRVTAVVRDFVEDCHRIRAPEQTTHEFLAVIARDPRFSPPTVAAFARLLREADRVKFAAAVPPPGGPGRAVDFVRSFVQRERHRLAAQS